MFKINEDMSIYLTRGDAASIVFSAFAASNSNEDTGGGLSGEDYGDADTVYPTGADSEDTGSATTETRYQFRAGDIVRFKVFEKKGCDKVVLCKDTQVENPGYEVTIKLRCEDTRFCEEISKPKDYWYEIELNPDIAGQTIVGYDEDGPKVFRLFPEGGSGE